MKQQPINNEMTVTMA